VREVLALGIGERVCLVEAWPIQSGLIVLFARAQAGGRSGKGNPKTIGPTISGTNQKDKHSISMDVWAQGGASKVLRGS